MQTSDVRRQTPLWQRALRAVLVLAALVVADVLLTYALEPYGSASDSVWYEYRQACQAGERFDTVVIGSSVAQDSLQPGPIDQTLGTHSFCLASPGQSLKSSYEALKLVLDEQPVSRVILGTSYTQLAEEPWANSNMAFAQAMAAGRPLGQKALRYLGLALDQDYVGGVSSLAFFMPFTLSHVDYKPSAVLANLRNRAECATPLEAQARLDATWHPLGRGYANYDGTLDTKTYGANYLGVNHLAYLGLGGKGLNKSELSGLLDICALCKERGVELVVFAAPHPRFEVLSIGEAYPEGMAEVERIVQEHGGIFLDFNLIHPDVYDIQEQDFIDATHLNMGGAERFSTVFADVVSRASFGQGVGSLFFSYADWGGYLASLDSIYYVYCMDTRAGNTVTLEATAYAGPSCQLEFAFELQEEDGSWTRVRDWSDDPTCVLSGYGYRDANICVMARQLGATEPERTHIQSVTFLGE